MTLGVYEAKQNTSGLNLGRSSGRKYFDVVFRHGICFWMFIFRDYRPASEIEIRVAYNLFQNKLLVPLETLNWGSFSFP